MKPLKLSQNTPPSATQISIQQKLDACLHNENSQVNLTDLLQKVRRGDTTAIQQVFEASEGMIYKVMLTMPDSRFSIDERFSIASNALEKLAFKELNSSDPEQFLQYDAWSVRQALLELERGGFLSSDCHLGEELT